MFVKVGSFNILAPSWASPQFYPERSHALLFPSERRIDRVVRFLLTNLKNTDVLALQETEHGLDSRISQLLADKYVFFSVYHDDSYWAKWVTEDRPYRRNGVAIAVKKGVFDQVTSIDLPLGTGNHAQVVICRHIALDRWFRIVSVHFELDETDIREQEVEAVANYLRSEGNGRSYVDVVAGDFNSDLDSDLFASLFFQNGFRDAHRHLDETYATHPEKLGDDCIDHILVRGNHVEPIIATVHASDIMSAHPEGSEAHKEERLARCLEFNGSDHFAIDTTLFVGNNLLNRGRTRAA